ncbi:C3a anaphylatoxin chemotactic receptor [Latimeria chalumnae]|uniref:C3a anaphylatoxin chemotactic receptor n=1 Tax=Latimeria chalumnae TaxID=7897 RepID=UPI0003C187D0|nr:PREDICTED: C3a anaphylatoxin chemotactic receptor-like [Latimeria chalumnae]|eukprot:XP_006004734.1 PREDICTED: C3a anaphylatoxin chemotactic receptor-like [Latimeria chalumnae]
MTDLIETDTYPDYNYSYYNDSNFWNIEDELDTETFHPITVISMVIYSITVVLGIPGNAVVIWIAGIKMKKTVNTVWFLNLAIADLLCCLSLPFSIAQLALHYHWPLGRLLCKLIPSAIILCMSASIFTLTAISVDRCLLVLQPIWSQNNRTTRLASTLCLVIWGLAILMSLPVFIYRDTETDDKIIHCSYPDQDKHIMITTNVTRAIFGFFNPFLVIAICYTVIILKVKGSRFGKSSKTFKVILSVIVAFFVCWAPYHVTGLLQAIGDPETSHSEVSVILDPLAISLAYFNSCINPILYMFMGQDFKEKFRKSLKNILESAFSEGPTLSTIHSKGRTTRSSSGVDLVQVNL